MIVAIPYLAVLEGKGKAKGHFRVRKARTVAALIVLVILVCLGYEIFVVDPESLSHLAPLSVSCDSPSKAEALVFTRFVHDKHWPHTANVAICSAGKHARDHSLSRTTISSMLSYTYIWALTGCL